MNKISFNFITFIIILIYYLIFDFTMISIITNKVFSKMIKNIQKEKMVTKIGPTIISFIALSLGLYIFVFDRIRDNYILEDSAKYAIPWGIIVYAIYDLTNLAIIKNWSIKVSIFDICWGGILSFIVIILTKLTMKKIKENNNNN